MTKEFFKTPYRMFYNTNVNASYLTAWWNQIIKSSVQRDQSSCLLVTVVLLLNFLHISKLPSDYFCQRYFWFFYAHQNSKASGLRIKTLAGLYNLCVYGVWINACSAFCVWRAGERILTVMKSWTQAPAIGICKHWLPWQQVGRGWRGKLE